MWHKLQNSTLSFNLLSEQKRDESQKRGNGIGICCSRISIQFATALLYTVYETAFLYQKEIQARLPGSTDVI